MMPPSSWLSASVGLMMRPGVVRGDDPKHAHESGIDVHLDFGELRAECHDRRVRQDSARASPCR